jgi:diacylglycerol O-acyltransferase / wax synthase
MGHSERMSPVDTTWLRMDRPVNLMMIVAVWLLEGPVDLDKVEKQIAEGLLSYPRFRQKVEFTPAGVFWRDDANFDLAHHIKRVRLPGRGDKQALERFVGELASEPLDPNRPLWTEHIVENYEGGAALVFRGHHAIADGMALMGVTMSVVDGAAQKGRRQESAAEEGWLQTLTAPIVSAIAAGTKATASTLGAGLDLALHPLRAAGYVRDGAGVAGELAYLLLMKSDSATRFKGKPQSSKRAAWCEPLKLSEVKAVSHALGCSVNDILLSCAAGAMRRYLADKGDTTEGVEIRAIVPIDLRESGDSTLGNRFGLLAVELPVGVADPIERLLTVRQRMLALKSSYEPSTTLGLFAALGYVPKMVQDQMLNLLASRATAVMTNVPGPTESLTLAGSRIKQWVSWVPQSGDIGMGVAIASYAGHVQFGLITDAALTPDPEALVSRFPEEFERYLYSVLLRSPSAAEGTKTVPPPARGDRDIAEPSGAPASVPARLARRQRRPHGRRESGGRDARKRSVKRLRRRA